MRKLVIAGNWKMNKTRDEVINFILDVSNHVPKKELVETVIFAQPIHLRCLVKRQGENLRIGAQNIHFEANGAYTGELSPVAVKDIWAEYCLIGHSERREMFNETDESVNKKLHSALAYDLKPIVCVGENLSQRENDETNDVIKEQVTKAFANISSDQAKEVIIAYEPIWAIGTGRSATSLQAEETCKAIRDVIESLYGTEVSETIRIQYGGSVNPGNFKELMDMPNIDGALIGGASLDSKSFLDMLGQLK